MKIIALFVVLVSLVVCLSEWQTHLQSIAENAYDYSSKKQLEEKTLLETEINKEAHRYNTGVDLMKLARSLKTAVRKNPDLPHSIVELLEKKSAIYQKQGGHMILKENPSMFDDL